MNQSNQMVHFLLFRWKLRPVYLSLSHFLRPSAASLISSHHLSLSLLSQYCCSHTLCFLFSFVFHRCSMICLPWTRVLWARFLLSAVGEILTRLWCLLIVPLSNWDAPWSPSPWWHWQPVPLVTVSHPQKHQRERWVGESWGKMERRKGIRKEKHTDRALVVL